MEYNSISQSLNIFVLHEPLFSFQNLKQVSFGIKFNISLLIYIIFLIFLLILDGNRFKRILRQHFLDILIFSLDLPFLDRFGAIGPHSDPIIFLFNFPTHIDCPYKKDSDDKQMPVFTILDLLDELFLFDFITLGYLLLPWLKPFEER